MKKVFEKIAGDILACSSFVTSFTIVPIALFLFSEVVGLSNSRVTEEGCVLALSKDSKVNELTPVQIKDIFGGEITNWQEIDGENLPIRLFHLEGVTHYYAEKQLRASYENMRVCIANLVERMLGIVAFMPQQFIDSSGTVRLLPDSTTSLKDVFTGAEWFPTATSAPQPGLLPLITGTLWMSLFTILIVSPFNLAVVVYMFEVADHKIWNLVKPTIELLSGTPSIVYSSLGLIMIAPFLQKVFDLPVGEGGLAGSIVPTIMALSTIIMVARDAMRNYPRIMWEAGLALGASQWQIIYKVVIPCSISGITPGVVLGIGRVVDETMTILMMVEDTAVTPHTILEPLYIIPATIATGLGEAPVGGAHYETLFLLGVVLFFVSLSINFTVEAVSSGERK